MKTIETNQIIAEFMGGRLSNVPDLINLPQTIGDAKIHCVKGSELLPNGTYRLCYLHELQYHSSWDWLMPCLQKILELDEVAEDMEKYYTIVDNIPNIESTHQAVVEFIQWYNQKN